jgi:hypothetical protein
MANTPWKGLSIGHTDCLVYPDLELDQARLVGMNAYQTRRRVKPS